MKINYEVCKTGQYAGQYAWVYDNAFDRALKDGRKMVSRAKLNQWYGRFERRSWRRMSLPWEKKEDDLILSFMAKYEGTGGRGDVIHCLAWCIERTTTSIATRINTLKKDKCPCCGK